MKKSKIAIGAVFFGLIPLTLWLGTRMSGRSYYLTATLIIAELLLPFFLAFEGRKPHAREIVLLAVMCALAVAGRVVIPLPNFKATFAMIILTGIAFGVESGFMVGAMTAFASNFFYGQGPFTPWQMMAYGACGLLAGLVFEKRRSMQKTWIMAVYGFASVLLWVGPLLDCAHIFLSLPQITWPAVWAVLLSGFYINLSQSISTALILFVLGRPILDKLERIRIKYGLLEDEHGA